MACIEHVISTVYVCYHLLVLNGDYRCKVSFDLVMKENWEKVAHFQLYTEVATSVVADYMREGEEGGVRGEEGRRRGEEGGVSLSFIFFSPLASSVLHTVMFHKEPVLLSLHPKNKQLIVTQHVLT